MDSIDCSVPSQEYGEGWGVGGEGWREADSEGEQRNQV